MQEKRYPASKFIMFYLFDLIFHFFWLFIPSILFLIVGIFVKPFFYIGLVLLIIDLLFSLIDQLRLRKIMVTDSENPDFLKFQKAIDNGNLMNYVQEIREQQEKSNTSKEKSKSNMEDEKE